MAIINPVTIGGGLLLLWLLSGGKKEPEVAVVKETPKPPAAKPPVAKPPVAQPPVGKPPVTKTAPVPTEPIDGTWLPVEPSKFSQMPAKKPGFVLNNDDTFIVLARYGHPDAVVARVRVIEVFNDPTLGPAGRVVTVPLAKGSMGKVAPASGEWDKVVEVDSAPEDFFSVEGTLAPPLGVKYTVPASYEIEATSIKDMLPDEATEVPTAVAPAADTVEI